MTIMPATSRDDLTRTGLCPTWCVDHLDGGDGTFAHTGPRVTVALDDGSRPRPRKGSWRRERLTMSAALCQDGTTTTVELDVEGRLYSVTPDAWRAFAAGAL